MVGVERLVGDLESRFSVPPAYAAAWLTDFRPDDGQRWFDYRETADVERTDSGFRIVTDLGYGKNVNDVVIESPSHWTVKGQFVDSKGRVYHETRLDQTVSPEGAGSLYRVRVWITPRTLGARMRFTTSRRSVVKSLSEGFDRMKQAMEREYASSQTPGTA